MNEAPYAFTILAAGFDRLRLQQVRRGSPVRGKTKADNAARFQRRPARYRTRTYARDLARAQKTRPRD